MQSRIELEKTIYNIINELNYCTTLLVDLHPKCEKISQRILKVINSHIGDMNMILELCDDNLNIKDPIMRDFIENMLTETLQVMAQTLELTGTLLEYTVKLRNEIEL